MSGSEEPAASAANAASGAPSPTDASRLESLSKAQLVSKVQELKYELKQADEQLRTLYQSNSELKEKLGESQAKASAASTGGGETAALKDALRKSEDEVRRLNTLVSTLKMGGMGGGGGGGGMGITLTDADAPGMGLGSPMSSHAHVPTSSHSDGAMAAYSMRVEQLTQALAGEQEGRRSAIEAWEVAEKKVAEAEDRRRRTLTEARAELRKLEESKWNMEKKLKWQKAKTTDALSHVSQLEEEIVKKNDVIMDLQIQVNSVRANIEATDRMERLKTQATLESMKRDQVWRERFYRNTIESLQQRIATLRLNDVRLQKQLSEVNLQVICQRQAMQRMQRMPQPMQMMPNPASVKNDKEQMQMFNSIIEAKKKQIEKLSKRLEEEEAQRRTRSSNLDLLFEAPPPQTNMQHGQVRLPQLPASNSQYAHAPMAGAMGAAMGGPMGGPMGAMYPGAPRHNGAMPGGVMPPGVNPAAAAYARAMPQAAGAAQAAPSPGPRPRKPSSAYFEENGDSLEDFVNGQTGHKTKRGTRKSRRAGGGGRKASGKTGGSRARSKSKKRSPVRTKEEGPLGGRWVW